VSVVRIAAGEQFETATPQDIHNLYAKLDARFAEQTREALRGMKLMRFPTLSAQAAGTSLVLPATASGYGLVGPESGFIWEIGRLTVASNGTDMAGTSTPAVGQPAVPASGVAQENNNAFPVRVVISGGTLTAVVVNGVTVGNTAGTYTVPAQGAIFVTYSVAPTWVWSALGLVTSPGAGVSLYTTSDETQQQGKLIDSSLQVGLAYRPGSDALYLMPGEGVSVVINSTPGNVYTLTGQVWSCPAEMMAKLH
jgi:hypothetical protein